MASLLRPGGLFVASVRDYDTMAEEKPRVSDQRVFGGGAERRVVFQVWDWRRDGRGYRIHQYALAGPVADVQAVETTQYTAGVSRLAANSAA